MLPGLNIVHLLVILVVALLVFGPDEAPKLVRRAAGAFQDLQRLREQLHEPFAKGHGAARAAVRAPADHHVGGLSQRERFRRRGRGVSDHP